MQELTINFFKDDYEKFSNFYPVTIDYEGITYPSVEHAYQAAKTKDKMIRIEISKIPKPGKAKTFARKIKLRSDWEMIKISVMRSLLIQKFSKDEFKELLISTNNSYIEEGNYWHDNFWGNCYCKKCKEKEGKNLLGKLLMKIRSELLYE